MPGVLLLGVIAPPWKRLTASISAEKVRHLQHSVGTRDLIGQAKGILMERFKISPNQAFLLLTRASETSNRN